MDNHKKELVRLTIMVTQIGEAIKEQVDRDNPDELTGKLQELASLQGTASWCLATAKSLYNSKIASLLVSDFYNGYTATDRKTIFLELAKEELFMLNIVERYVANISHSIESFRSILSYKKLEFEQSKYQTT